ncbi:MAG: hypothetical protein AAGA60_12115 [Cyanobacteria bacterium P01_E01_bin.42]
MPILHFYRQRDRPIQLHPCKKNAIALVASWQTLRGFVFCLEKEEQLLEIAHEEKNN